MEENKKDDFKFTHTISCPNCPINCFSYKGAIRHAEICNERRKDGVCCMCKNPKVPDFYEPLKGRHWFICWKCYGWARQKLMCL